VSMKLYVQLAFEHFLAHLLFIERKRFFLAHLANFIRLQAVFHLVGDFHERVDVLERIFAGSAFRAVGHDQFPLFIIADLPHGQSRQLADGADRDYFLLLVRSHPPFLLIASSPFAGNHEMPFARMNVFFYKTAYHRPFYLRNKNVI